VGFRWFVRQHARALELSGWVRNLPSGNVELIAHGTVDNLDKLEVHLRIGPPGASVEHVRRAPQDGELDLAFPFTIVR
ncbi:MAG: acylphosphatase, partial [Gemmatimonadota bacterium]